MVYTISINTWNIEFKFDIFIKFGFKFIHTLGNTSFYKFYIVSFICSFPYNFFANIYLYNFFGKNHAFFSLFI